MDYNEQASIVDKTITGDTDDAEDQQDYDIDQIYKSMVAEEFHLSCELGSDISITLSDDDNGEKPAKIRKIEKQKEDAKSVKQKDDGQDDGISVDESMFQQPPLQERPSLFDAPTVEQLQQALIALGIDPEEAYGSPLLLHHNNNISQKAENPFAIHKIDGDGNCGFRAVSYLLTGTQKYHWQLRLIEI